MENKKTDVIDSGQGGVKKYIKFTEGQNETLTINKPYEVLGYNSRLAPCIMNDTGLLIHPTQVGYIMSSRTDCKWQWCDENGKEVTK